MIGSCHLEYYFKIWGNVYRLSQQGWENMNSLIKRFYFRRTQRGGFARNKDISNSSKLIPISKWMQTKLM